MKLLYLARWLHIISSLIYTNKILGNLISWRLVLVSFIFSGVEAYKLKKTRYHLIEVKMNNRFDFFPLKIHWSRLDVKTIGDCQLLEVASHYLQWIDVRFLNANPLILIMRKTQSFNTNLSLSCLREINRGMGTGN